MSHSCSKDSQAYHQVYGVLLGCCLAASLMATIVVIAEPKIVVGTVTSAKWIARVEFKSLASLEGHGRYSRWSVVWATTESTEQLAAGSFVAANSTKSKSG